MLLVWARSNMNLTVIFTQITSPKGLSAYDREIFSLLDQIYLVSDMNIEINCVVHFQ